MHRIGIKFPAAFSAVKKSIFSPPIRNSIKINNLKHLSSSSVFSKDRVSFTVELYGGQRIPMNVECGVTLRDAIAEIKETGEDYGVCGATLACSTCHVMLSKDIFEKLRHELSDEEMDILDLAPGIDNLSRLACAIIVGPELEGALFKLPEDRKDCRDDGKSETAGID